MQTYTISKDIHPDSNEQISEKTACAGRLFGLTRQQIQNRTISYRAEIDICPGDVVYITGASGAGKSVVLRELESAVPPEQRINLDQIKIPEGASVIDCIDAPTIASLKILSLAGLAETYCILNSPANLSEGEKYRFRLALALSVKKQFIFADEFCCNLDRISASVISWRIREYAKKTGTTFVLAAAHEDILMDLQPDTLVIIDLTGRIEIQYKTLERK
jgi:ABC-type ATPase with predicted acetyltransferase domain